MDKSRNLVRWVSFAAFGIFAIPIAVSVVGEFFVELAREKGLYASPSQRLDAAVIAVSTFVAQTWFLCAFSAAGGFILGVVGFDFVLRTSKTEQDRESPISDDLKITLQQTYASTGLLDNYRASIEFLIAANDVRICLDYRGKTQDERNWGAWTRVTLISKDFVAKGEYVHKQIFSMQRDERKSALVIESPNDFDGKKRTLPERYFMECVVIVFYSKNKEQRDARKPFLITAPFLHIRAWPEITTDIRLDFRGMD